MSGAYRAWLMCQTNTSIEAWEPNCCVESLTFARDEKPSRIMAKMLRDNLAIQIVFKRLGFRLRLLVDPTSVQAVLDL